MEYLIKLLGNKFINSFPLNSSEHDTRVQHNTCQNWINFKVLQCMLHKNLPLIFIKAIIKKNREYAHT